MSHGFLIYAIVPSAQREPLASAIAQVGTGIGQTALELVASTDHVAIVSRLQGPHRLRDVAVEILLEYERAVASLHDRIDLVPCRYGSVLASKQTVCNHLEAESARYLRAYQRIVGCSEYSVRLLIRAPVPPPPQPRQDRSGAAFLRARKQHYAHAQTLENQGSVVFETLYKKLGCAVREHTVEALPHSQGLRAMFLLTRSAHAQLKAEFRRWRMKRDANLTGPWPPFHFV